MKKILFLLLLSGPVLLSAQILKQLKKTMELKMPGKVLVSKRTGEDSLPGTRGASVAWHPVQKKYYAAFAGNASYPLAVFDATGKILSDEDLNTMADLRGLWYNSTLKKICGNGYNETGWFDYTLDAKGIPEDVEILMEGLNQPTEQSVGVYNPKSDMVYFLNNQFIHVYNAEAMEEEDSTIRIYAGTSKKEEIEEDDKGDWLPDSYNYTTVIYTGIPKAEFGLLNTLSKQVELYNRKTGLLTQKLQLPDEVELYTGFNFSYCNGTYWFFNQETRTWTGYK